MQRKEVMEVKNLCKQQFFGGDSHHSWGLATESKRSSITKQGSKGCAWYVFEKEKENYISKAQTYP